MAAMSSMFWKKSDVFFPTCSSPSTLCSTCPSSATTLASRSSLTTPSPTAFLSRGAWPTPVHSGAPVDEHFRRRAAAPEEETQTLCSLLSSPDARVVFGALAKVRDSIQQIHREITSLCGDSFAQHRASNVVAADAAAFRQRAVAAYLGLRCVTQIADATITPHPDILLLLLCIYNPLADLFGFALAAFLPVLEQLSVESRSGLSGRFHGTLLVLRRMIRRSLAVLGVRIISAHSSSKPAAGTSSPGGGGGVDEITAYLVKHIKLLLDHGSLLSVILASDRDNPEQAAGSSSSMNTLRDCVVALISCLETALEKKSTSLQATSAGLKWLFLANNAHHVLKQVEAGTEMKLLLEDDWIIRRREQLQGYISSYVVVSWEPLLSCLQPGGVPPAVSRAFLPCFALPAATPTLSRFNLKFEEIYGAHKPWKVEEAQLRKHMRGVVTEKLIPTYRLFLRKHQGRPVKFIKYTPEEIEERLSELYEG